MTKQLSVDQGFEAGIGPTGWTIQAKLDSAGLLLAAALVAWSLFAAAPSFASAVPAIGLIGATTGAFVVGRVLASLDPRLPAACVATLVFVGVLVWVGRQGLGSVLEGPISYQNANAALILQGYLGALSLAISSRERGSAGWPAVGMALLLFGALLSAGSIAGVVLGLVLTSVVLVGWRVIGTRTTVLLCAGLVAAALATTLVVASTPPSSPVAGAAATIVTERRVELWQDSLRMMLERPLTGVGPGRFAEEGRIAREDADARWAHHGFLQVGAETGIPGLLFFLLLSAWGFARLWIGPREAVVGVGAAALAGLLIHACLDYVLHFAAPVIAAALLVGGSTLLRGSAPAWNRP